MLMLLDHDDNRCCLIRGLQNNSNSRTKAKKAQSKSRRGSRRFTESSRSTNNNHLLLNDDNQRPLHFSMRTWSSPWSSSWNSSKPSSWTSHVITMIMVAVGICCVVPNLSAFRSAIIRDAHSSSFAPDEVPFLERFLQQDAPSNTTTFTAVPTSDNATTDEEQQLSVDVSFEDILKTVIFLMASWMMAVLSQVLGLPSLVGEICTGFILGPPLLDFVAYPEAMVLIGSFGLIGLLLDSGINLDIAQLRETGSRAVAMAVTGTVLALSVGLGMGYAAYTQKEREDGNKEDTSGNWFRSSFAVGAAFAPSSFGVASQVLSKGEILNTPMGQVIVAGSVCDDILGLILLSIMEVLVKETPTIMDYIVPFLSSFGYLIVLGYIGIKVVPNLVEQKILPRFQNPATRDFVGFSLLFILLALYLPLLNYSGASYLTGAFLAGLSFSQINSVHSQYLESGPHLKIWLMRIFFAATIGFQVPVQYFTNGDVQKWGLLYVLPVLAKLPLGFMVPRFSRELPDDFPYDPYWKDVIITTLAFMCRGEFNFIVASFALGAGVLEPEQYAAVVFAVLLSAVICPLLLTKAIRYYNTKFTKFLEGKHKVDRIDNTTDGTRPLFLAIQARTPITWGIQEKFVHTLESVGLIVIDHRSWHTLGLEAVNITEIFCQDKMTRVRMHHAFKSRRGKESTVLTRASTLEESPGVSSERSAASSAISTIPESPGRENLAVLEDVEEQIERDEIDRRKQVVRAALVDCLGSDVDEKTYAIVVSQWEVLVFDDATKDSEDAMNHSVHAGYRLVEPAPAAVCSSNGIDNIENDEDGENGDDTRIGDMPMLPTLDEEAQAGEGTTKSMDDTNGTNSSPASRRHRRSVSVGGFADMGRPVVAEPKLDVDLWDMDPASHQAVSQGYFMETVDDLGSQVVMEGCGSAGRHHRRFKTADSAAIMDHGVLDPSLLQGLESDIEISTIKDRLRGYIR